MKQLLTIKQVSAKTGFAVKTIYEWVAKRKIPFYKINGNLRFDEQNIDNWISRSEVKAKTFL